MNKSESEFFAVALGVNFAEINNLIPDDENIYVVIMTIGYRTDAIALSAIINRNFKYLGLLGSKTKIETMFLEFKNAGIKDEKIKKIFAPIGFNINSQTPMEIAVSIAAEIIKIKNSN